MRARGGAMVPALALLSAIVAVLASIAALQRSALEAATNRVQAERARLMAESGLERALAALESVQMGLVRSDDEWAAFGRGEERYLLDGGSFRVEVVDACSRIDINTVDQVQLENLELTSEQIDSLLDWREPELQPRPEGGKDEFYNNLPEPYNTKLRAFDSVDELLLVKGWDGPTLYEPLSSTSPAAPVFGSGREALPLSELLTADAFCRNLAPDGEAKLNVNTVDANQMIQRGVPAQVAQAIVQRRNQQGTFASLSQVLAVPGVNLSNAGTLIDVLTVTGDAEIRGRINLNTASQAVLETIPDLGSDVAQSIANQGGFTSYTEVAAISGVDLRILGILADRTTLGSSSFLVRVLGTAGRVSVALEAVVRNRAGRWVLEKVFQPPFGDMPARWGWVEETSNEVDLRSSQ
ncbi:MAG: type II secretion system protein GspK [Fimbriimonadales bacterium]|nr:type II secretion system protein GspK [Fimbriimonadales bacterium]